MSDVREEYVVADEHLRECERCRNAYREERNFGDMLDTDLTEPSKKLDEKLMMKLKISRCRRKGNQT